MDAPRNEIGSLDLNFSQCQSSIELTPNKPSLLRSQQAIPQQSLSSCDIPGSGGNTCFGNAQTNLGVTIFASCKQFAGSYNLTACLGQLHLCEKTTSQESLCFCLVVY